MASKEISLLQGCVMVVGDVPSDVVIPHLYMYM